jgi:hypothetical protein
MVGAVEQSSAAGFTLAMTVPLITFLEIDAGTAP